MNTTAKGSLVELKAYKELQDYPLRWKTCRNKWQNLDMFNCFDIVVGDEKSFRFIQVKTGYCPHKDRDAIRALRLPFNCVKEIWCWFGARKGWRKEIVP